MQQEDNGLLLIKHCRNFQRLSIAQLHAIKEDNLNMVNELAAQKQIIIECVMAMQAGLDINRYQPDVKREIQELLNGITSNENNSMEILNERCRDISSKMMSMRRELNIQQAYEEQFIQKNGVMLNIKK